MSYASNVPLVYMIILASFLLSTIHGEPISVVRSTYIVHMDKSLMPKAFTGHQNWYSSIIDSFNFQNHNSLEEHKSSSSLLYIYDYAIHGFSAFLSLNELKALKKSLGFISAHSDAIGTLDTTHTPEFLSLNPTFGLWPHSNFGKNVVIGIVDSGIWPESLSFKDHNMTAQNPPHWNGKCEGGTDFNSSICNFKIIGARYFNEGLKKKLNGNMLSVESARDTKGHGTRISSIAAGNYVKGVSYFGYADGTAKGVAPLAKIAIYKVSWEEGCSIPDVLAGMDQAIADGVDVMSISLSFILEPYDDPIAKASFAAIEKGIVVTASSGNVGPGVGTLRNGIPWILTVAAGTIDRWFAGILKLGNGIIVNGWSMFTGNALLLNLSLVYDNTLASCNSSTMLSKAPYGIIICNVGNIDNQIESLVASNRSAGAILVFDEPALLELQEVPYPCVLIRSVDAPTVINYAKYVSAANASITFKQTIMGMKHAPTVANYSPKGPSPSFPSILKPDVMAPGSLVVAASIPKELALQVRSSEYLQTSYTMISGTSYAQPHVAGVAALLKSAYPNWSAAAIKSAIMTTANELDNTLNPIRDYKNDNRFGNNVASPLAMGAGHINPNQALDPGMIYDITPQDYVNFLCSSKYKDHISAITRSTVYNCSNKSSDLNYPSFITFYTDPTKPVTEKFQRTVTNVGEGVIAYEAQVKSPEDFVLTVLPTRLAFKRKYEKQSYTLTIEYKGNKDWKFSFGWLLWVEQNQSNLESRHIVRSPIVVSPRYNYF